MADPLTVLGGGAAIIQLADACVKTARFLHRFYKNNDVAVEEIHRFEVNLRSFSDMIKLADMALQQHYKARPQSPVFTYIQTHRVIDTIAERSRLIIDGLKDARDWVKSAQGAHKFMITLKWWFKKKELLAFGPEMESVINRLQLMITIAKFEAIGIKLKSSPASAEDKEELALLKNVIKNQMEQIRVLEAQLSQTHRPFGGSTTRLQTAPSLDMAPKEALFELGSRIAQDGMVPETRPIRTAHPRSTESSTVKTSRRRPESSQTFSSVTNSDGSFYFETTEKRMPGPSRPSISEKLPTPVQQPQASVSGYVGSLAGPAKSAIAIIDGRRQTNGISISEAKRLRLVISPIDPNDELLWLKERSVPIEKPLGQVSFHWWYHVGGMVETRTKSIVCVVSGYEQHALVFGKSLLHLLQVETRTRNGSSSSSLEIGTH